MLRHIRIILAIIVGIAMLYAFVSLRNSIYTDITTDIAEIQLLPAILAGSTLIYLSIFLLTFIFGRVYCSVICPLGILQDAIRRVIAFTKKRFKIKRNNKNRGYKKALNLFRYSVLVVTVLSLIGGIGIITNLLDPYTQFGIIANNIFRHIYVFFNNILALILNSMDNYFVYFVNNELVSVGGLIYSVVIATIIILLVNYRGRIWCNTICPVGATLSLFSKYSLFKITIDKNNCNNCKACSFECKANCIEEKTPIIDSSRCVGCFNCINKCKKGAISYKISSPFKQTKQEAKPINKDEDTTSRRDFLALIASATVAPQLKEIPRKLRLDAARYPMPPGAMNKKRFELKCTGCQLCVSRCPTHVLKPAMFSRGINSFMQPYMAFDVHKFCEYECKICMEVCPNNALVSLPLEEKKILQTGVVRFNQKNCIVDLNDKHCGACAEHCPTGAVIMVDFKNGLTIPEIHPEFCIGCGACESICPVLPDAIYIVGNDEQINAEPPYIEESKEINVDSFGF